MANNNYFKFKQFTIQQEKSAMKVGTDGVLLGAWTDVSNAENILDVGTGTGLIALMLAQRTNAKIEAIEIERNAAIEADKNVKNSPWEDRISILNASFQDFARTTKSRYDLIVSNPPFFENSIKNKNKQQTIARHTELMSYTDLISGVKSLMRNTGSFSLILPSNRGVSFINVAAKSDLFLSRLTEVKPNNSKMPNRYLMQFSHKKTALVKDCLNIYDGVGNYSESYRDLTNDYYLKF